MAAAIFCSCRQIAVKEKLVNMPRHQWQQNLNAVVLFDITDSAYHQLYFVVRHTERFEFTHLVTKLNIQDTAKHTLVSMVINAPLTNSAGNWSGSRMDDIYYHRVKIKPPLFLKPGRYRFVLQNRMRQETIKHILNLGIAIDD